jgi:hypothetical protein
MGPAAAKLLPNHVQSDPICSSSGWCGPNIAPKSKTDADVLYPTGTIDKDIVDTQKHLKDSEKKLGTWDLPAKETKKALLQADQAIKGATNAINLNQVSSKTATKSAIQAKLMTRQEKASSFAQLREKMMSNWGTK